MNHSSGQIDQHLRDIAQGLNSATDSFLETLINYSGCSLEDAIKVAKFYSKKKMINKTGFGTFSVKHGGYLDKDFILETLESLN